VVGRARLPVVFLFEELVELLFRSPLPGGSLPLIALMCASESLVDRASTVLVWCSRSGLVAHATDLCGLHAAE